MGDVALVERLRRGDRLAFRELYAGYAQPTFGFLLRLAGRREMAEDLHQEPGSLSRHAALLRPQTNFAAVDLHGRPQPISFVEAARDAGSAGGPGG